MDDEARMTVIGLLMFVGVGAILLWIISFAVRSASTHQQRTRDRVADRWSSTRERSSAIQKTGPGQFKVCGVDRQSKLDTTWYVKAESEQNARVKAELEGIVVTAVERVS